MAESPERKRKGKGKPGSRPEILRNTQGDRFVADAERLTDLEEGEGKFRDALRRVATARPKPE